jgi:hypothetical protein
LSHMNSIKPTPKMLPSVQAITESACPHRGPY